VTPGPRDGKVGGVTVADMRAFSSLAWVAAARRLSVVFTIGILLLRPCAAAEGDGGFGEGLGEGLGEKVVRFLSPEMRRMKAEAQALRDDLRTLPPAPERQTTARLGYHSGYSKAQDTVEWVDMDLKETHRIDAIVLIGTPSDSGGAAEAGYGFPLRFRIEISEEGNDAERVVVADQTQADFPNPGALPVYLPVPGLRARQVRLTATRLAREGERFFFSLGEVMVLSGGRNVAIGLDRDAFGNSRTMGAVPMWGLANLVDGHIACGPPVGTEPSPTLGYQSRMVILSREPDPAPRWVQVDLGETVPVDEVRLFPAHPPDFAHRKGFGYPQQARLELSSTADFSDAKEVFGLRDSPLASPPLIVNPGDNVVTYNAGGTSARYVRFTATQLFNANGQFNLALSEMQVWSGGENVALGKEVSAFDSTETGGWSKAALVDGYTSTANILDWPEWLGDLSRRREVSQQIAALQSRKEQLVRQWQRWGLGGLGGLGVAGAAAAIAWSARQGRARRREMEALRQRIARDLHDEIGSSLGSIALITQDILAGGEDGAQTREDLGEIKHIADETVSAMRDITRLIQSDRYGSDDLATLLRETAARLLRATPYDLTIEAAKAAGKLPVDRQRDLILMFKEALHNIIRHAAATAVEIRLVQSNGQLSVTLHDNGRGFDPAAATEGMGLTNLRRRAAKHGGSVRIDSAPAQGTTLTISLPVHD
jgi:signal transduction histidine kinase